MVRVGQSSERAQLIYQHSTKEHQRKLAADLVPRPRDVDGLASREA